MSTLLYWHTREASLAPAAEPSPKAIDGDAEMLNRPGSMAARVIG